MTGEVSHPLEFLFNILIPLAAGPLLMAYLEGVHILLFWAWISFRATRGADASILALADLAGMLTAIGVCYWFFG